MRFRNLVFFLSLLVICSCSVQKRHYKSGYYISWGKTSNQKQNSLPDKKESISIADKRKKNVTSVKTTQSSETVYASAGDLLNPIEIKSTSPLFFPPDDSCDVLIFKDGSEVSVKVTEVGINEIKYKRCNNLDGPSHISRKSEIFMIKYANGTKEVVRSENSSEQIKTYQPQQRPQAKSYNNRSRHLHPLAIPSMAVGAGNVAVGLYCLNFVAFGASYGILLIPLLLGLAAFIMGKLASNDIRDNPDKWKGKGFTTPGIITGIVVAGIAAMLLFLFSMAY
ncbi:MAG: hypothetical protein JNL60_04570 [Bacteroidia bacterium]|nr:hypothetical protein [Bacteroidia bacterium]